MADGKLFQHVTQRLKIILQYKKGLKCKNDSYYRLDEYGESVVITVGSELQMYCYLRQRGYDLPGVCLFVCLSVCSFVSNFT